MPAATPVVLLALAFASAHAATGPLNYLRPYLVGGAVGASISSAPALMRRLFSSRAARYIAEISYALYVFHGMFSASWLGSGDRTAKYLKRPLLIAVTFAAAHLSTFRFERPLIALGKHLGHRGVATRAESLGA